MTNSSPASVPDLALEAVDLVAHALVDLGQALEVEPHARDLHVAQHATSGSSTSSMSRVEPAVGELLALPGGERLQDDGVGAGRVVDVGGQAALLADLAEREAAARGLEQVGGRAACRGRGRGGTTPSALASWATTGRSPSAATSSSGRRTRRRARARRPRRRSASASSVGTSSPSGVSGATTATATSLPRSKPATSASVPARTRALTVTLGDRARARPSSPSPNASSRRAQRVAQLELAEDLAQPRAVGLARGLGHRVDLDRDVALDRRQLACEIRASSAWSVRFSLRLAPEISSMWPSTVLEVAEALQQLRRRSCRRSRGRRGCCPTCRP